MRTPLLLVVVLLSACSMFDKRIPGSCESDSECPVGMHCATDPFFKYLCVMPDGTWPGYCSAANPCPQHKDALQCAATGPYAGHCVLPSGELPSYETLPSDGGAPGDAGTGGAGGQVSTDAGDDGRVSTGGVAPAGGHATGGAGGGATGGVAGIAGGVGTGGIVATGGAGTGGVRDCHSGVTCMSPTPACAQSGACVECAGNGDCKDPTRPICAQSGVCVSCGAQSAGATACSAKDPSRPACLSSGACAECATSADCLSTTNPICTAAHVCGLCTRDSECTGIGPGICMGHQDGRCASDNETIFVRSTCGGGANGTTTNPYCSITDAVAAVRPGRALIAVTGSVLGGTIAPSSAGQVSIIGGTLGALDVASGANLYLRNVTIGPNPTVGLTARSSSVLVMDGVIVDGNKGGGILIDGATFKVSRSVISNNGPGSDGPIVWGGVLISAVSSVGGGALLDHVSIIDNKQVGVTCAAGINGVGVLATGNAGGVQVAPGCGMWSPCSTPSADCGAP